MREALAARSDDDFVIAAPVRRKSAVRQNRKQKKAGIGARLMSLALQYPGRVLVALVLTGCGAAIAWNALVLQTAPHPAPLFSQRDAAAAGAMEARDMEGAAEARRSPAPRAASPFIGQEAAQALSPESPLFPAPALEAGAAAAPAARPSSQGGISELIRNGGEVPRPPVRVSPGPAVVSTPTRPPARRDPIGEMIRLGGPVPLPPANVGRAEASDLVLNGQRALARLGYGIKVDGIMGAETRQAIERFEQDRRLPVTGEFSGRTARELSAASGIAVR